MDRHASFSLHNSLRIWYRYLAIVVASIPAAILAKMLIDAGLSEQTAMLVCAPFALVLAYVLWSLTSRVNKFSSVGKVGQKVILQVSGPRLVMNIAVRNGSPLAASMVFYLLTSPMTPKSGTVSSSGDARVKISANQCLPIFR